jgi:hypothetical protein
MNDSLKQAITHIRPNLTIVTSSPGTFVVIFLRYEVLFLKLPVDFVRGKKIRGGVIVANAN